MVVIFLSRPKGSHCTPCFQNTAYWCFCIGKHNSMEPNRSWEVNSPSPRILWNKKVHYHVHKRPPILRPCVTYRNKLFSYYEELLPCRLNPNWRTTPCRLTATSCSIHSRLPSISGGSFLHPQLKDVPCHGGRDPSLHRFSFWNTQSLKCIHVRNIRKHSERQA